ncbi:SPOR domain-containing protein [Chitinibacter sp. GC72]|uniref:SPOR domain-containing protein n=1 Tax=Chitinibacter sp. GC72 TaxID=1526917 RepID=UPI0012F8BB85|nr:SPOR domain-containing protein [Chitinibacter sp. GC72]
MANVSDELLQLRKRARRRLLGAIALVVFALTVLWTALDGEPPKSLLENQSVEIISSAPALSSVVSLDQPQVAVAPVASESAVQAVQEVVPVESVDASRIAPVALPGKLVTHQEAAPQVVAANESVNAAQRAATSEAAKPSARPDIVATAKPSARPTAPAKASPKPSPKPTTKPALDPKAILEGALDKTAAPKTGKVYYIQIGAYADPDKAAQTLKKLKDAGIPARSEQVSTPKGELTRVRIGPGNDEAKAKAWMQRLDTLGVPGTLVVKAAQ